MVGVDEANFMGADLIDVAGQLADSGKQVIMAGLDTDYMGRPFSPIPELLALRRIDYEDTGDLHAMRKSGQAHTKTSRIR